jgi:glycosyltransferase involved in cell wall biosynthesis
MKMSHEDRPITIFTPSCADENDTNAQNLTVKELVARLPADRFHVTMSLEGEPDPRIAFRPNTALIRWTKTGNALRLLRHCMFSRPHIYFFPRCGPLDRAWFDFRKYCHSRTALVSYIVMMMNEDTGQGLIGRSIREADCVCANSHFVAETVTQQFNVSPIVMPDGVDARSYFAPKNRAHSSGLSVLYAGSFSPRKRVEFVVEQAARWPNVEFRLAGKGPTEEHCRQLCVMAGVRNVRFLGHLSAAQLGDEMRRVDVFLFPSILEGQPQVLIQAAACGLPVVAMKSYHPDCVLDGQTGLLADSDEELCNSLELLLTNRELRHKMAEAAVPLAKRFDWDRIAEKWADLFCQVVARRQRSAGTRSSAQIAASPFREQF